MAKLYYIKSSEVGLVPFLLKGKEQHGLLWGMKWNCEMTGGQCSVCHTIVWRNGRQFPVHTGPLPKGVPNSGSLYKDFYKTKVREFLHSLPPCPRCKGHAHDLYITNVVPMRFEDGKENPDNVVDAEIIEIPADSVYVWVEK